MDHTIAGSAGKRVSLEKTMNPAGVLALAIGSIIGWGCFILPGSMLQTAGPLGAATAILLGGLVMLIIGKSYGHMIARLPVSGGEFAYAYHGFGRNHAFACGWFLALGYVSIIPLNATALTLLVQFIAPDLLNWGYLYSIANDDIYLGELAMAGGAILLFGILNFVGSKLVSQTQTYMVALLVIAVVIIAAGAATSEQASIGHLEPVFAQDTAPWAGILKVLAIAPFLFVGFDTIPQSAEEYKFSPSLASKLIAWSIVIGTLIYVAVLLETGVVIPWPELVSEERSWYTGFALEAAVGKAGIVFLAVAICMGICTGINGFMVATSRLLFSMGRAKVLPDWFTRVKGEHRVPRHAIVFSVVLALVAPLFGRNVIIWVVDMAALGTAFGYMYTCFSAWKDGRKPVALFGGLLSLGILLLLTLPGSPGFMSEESWWACLVWVVLGTVFYLGERKKLASIPKQEMDYLILDQES
ncbi:APC family permease [Parendozoicomonas haliclonae]|uniref:Phenylalanine-specific permease n=1 Tax=Parendozoicomonas haliclonae TaxID=1960125 RepID=A0A1X7AL34_9GAMM|nr:APC family permease [Parendozoicomonas haliclonae]SMA48593.1 Phenylalanine-specific permease [Parendozoicomonas haliclonae]